MELTELSIKNFRSIINETFELTNFTPLIGYNNAGKSNILEAILWLFENSSLSKNDFHNEEQNIEVSAVISNINTELIEPDILDMISPYVSKNSLFLKKTQKGLNGRQGVFFEVKDKDGQWEKLKTNTKKTKAILKLLPEPIHIGAMTNTTEDVSRNRTSTTIGKLLKRTLEPLEKRYGEIIEDALKEVKAKLESEGEDRAEELNQFDHAVNSKIREFFPDVKIKAHIPLPEIQDVFSRGTVKVFETADQSMDVSSMGHGAQRSIQMALIRHLGDLKRNTENENAIILMDEPELYLHPQAILILKESLKKLSRNGYQVIFSTHSPFMISSNDIENTLLIRKDEQKGTHKRQTIKSAINQLKIDAESQIELLYEFSNSANVLFADRVILAEGKTEKRILPTIFEAITGKSLETNKIALVVMDGANSIKKALDVLKTIGLPAKAIVDFDFVTKYSSHKLFDKEYAPLKAFQNFFSEKKQNWGLALTNENWPTKKGKILPEEAFSRLTQDSSLRESIKQYREYCKKNGIWVWEAGSIEHQVGKPKHYNWGKFTADIEKNGLQNTLNDDKLYNMLKEAINWLVSDLQYPHQASIRDDEVLVRQTN